MFVSPQNSSVAILTPTWTVLGSGAFGRWVGHEGGTLVNGITALTKRSQSECLLPYGGHSEKASSMNQKAGSHQTPNLLDT